MDNEEQDVQETTSSNPRRAFYTERFRTKFEEKFRKNKNACWVWTAYRDKDDYGQVRVGELGTFRAHRIAFELYTGEDIPETDENGEQMDIDHTCHIRRCVNPDHLELVTHGENMKNLRKSIDDWEDDGIKFKETKTTPEEVLDAALATIAQSNVPVPAIGPSKPGYAIVEAGGSPWRDIQTNDGFLPQDKFSLVKMFFNVIRLGVDWRLASREILHVSPFTVQGWYANGDFREELEEARLEGKRYRYAVLEDKHLDELERKIEDAPFKEVADSLEKMRKHDPATKKAEAEAAGSGGGVTIIFNAGDKSKALREMIDMSDTIEAEFEVKE